MLCRLTSTGNLVLVDQHAADERVRVEKYLQRLCEASATTTKEPPEVAQNPIAVPLSVIDVRSLIPRLSYFLQWGFSIRIPQDGGHNREEHVTVEVDRVPSIIEDRVRAEPHLLRHLIVQHLNNATAPTKLATQSNVPWYAKLSCCPKVLIDIVNSKACRGRQYPLTVDWQLIFCFVGAVMFNDPLTNEQAMTLLEKLTATQFPFQCAHGRPSLVPIINVGGLTTSTRSLHWSRLQQMAKQ